MRIIGGKYKGKKLYTPDGEQTRPMAIRIKEAIFNKLEHAFTKKDDTPILRNATLVDAFGGTGALALESLSRGAAHATIIELSSESHNIILRNIKAMALEPRTTLLKGDATRPPKAAGPVNIAFVAPPYRRNLVYPTLAALSSQGWIDGDTLVVIEIATSEQLDIPDEYDILFDKAYKTAHIYYVRRKGTS